MMLRTCLTAIVVLLYVVAFNCWMYMLANGMLTIKQNRLMFYSGTGLMILFSYWDLMTMTNSYYHSKFNQVAFFSILANFVLNVANHSGFVGSSGAEMMIIFNGLIFVLTAMILISGTRHGTFKD